MTTRHKTSYQLLTFYTFVDIPNAHQLIPEHKAVCHELGLQGRIYIGPEGISATLTGTTRQLRAYRQYLDQHQYFADIPDIDIKATQVDGHCFTKMIIKYREEIVAMGKRYAAEQIHGGGQRMTVDEFKKVMDEDKDDYVILDMRNTYEYKLGHFKNALPAGTINFRELEEYIDTYKEKFKNKKVVTYCTGGIRCEKATVMMREFGIDNVFQLDGGVMKYVNTHNDGNRHGNLYTFDGRVSMPIGDQQTHTTVGTCIYTGTPSDHCENCRYSPCNARLICSRKHYKKHMGFCSQECYDKAQQDLLIKNDLRDPMDYKHLRGLIKQAKITLTDAQTKVTKHLQHRLGDTTFNHQSSQKEANVDQSVKELLTDCAC